MDFGLDYSQVQRIDRAIQRMPQEMKAKAVSRAMRQVTGVGRTRIVDETSKISKMPKSLVSGVTKAGLAGTDTQKFIVRSDWIALMRLGAIQVPEGVYVNLRGSYKSAFIEAVKNGHHGVFRRVGKRRFPIREQFAANPANVVGNKPDEFTTILTDILAERYLPRLIHEVEYLLSKL